MQSRNSECKKLLESIPTPKFKPYPPFISGYIAPSGGGKTTAFVRMLMEIHSDFDHIILISPSGYPDEDCGLISEPKWEYAMKKKCVHQCLCDYDKDVLEQIITEQSARLKEYKLYLDLKKLWDKVMKELELTDKELLKLYMKTQ